MKYPCLVDKHLCTTPITGTLEQEGLSKYGAPLTPVAINTTCNYQDAAKTIYTKDKKVVQITGSALFPGDIAPSLPTISGGTATIYGVNRRVIQGTKARNPDGTVNYTRLDVI